MKLWTELTETELLALSKEDIEQLIDLECAIAGIPLLPACPKAPVEPEIQPPTTYYTVMGISVLTYGEALKIKDLVDSMETYNYEYRTGGKVLTKHSLRSYCKSEISSDTAFTDEQYLEKESAIKLTTELNDEYKQAKREFERISKKRAEVATPIYEHIEQVHLHRRTRECILAEYSRYLDLADGIHSIAYKFLNTVRDLTDFPEVCAYIKSEINRLENPVVVADKEDSKC